MKTKANILMLLVLILLLPVKTQAAEQYITTESDSIKKITGYEYKYKTVKVKKIKKKYLGKFTITYYCPCFKCCGSGGGKITASGTKPKAGKTVGVDPKTIPLGTKIKVGKKIYIAEDTGSGVRRKHIDIFVDSHEEALKLGVKRKKVWELYTVTKKKKVRVKCPILEE